MNALNQIILEGNVVRQPERKSCKNGASFCRIPIAVNRKYKASDGNYVDEVSYFDVATFGQTAELCEKWCPKGRGIRVVGRLKQTTMQTEDGKKRSIIEIIAEHVDFKPIQKKAEEGKALLYPLCRIGTGLQRPVLPRQGRPGAGVFPPALLRDAAGYLSLAQGSWVLLISHRYKTTEA